MQVDTTDQKMPFLLGGVDASSTWCWHWERGNNPEMSAGPILIPESKKMRPLLEIQKIDHSDEIVWSGMFAFHLALQHRRKAIGLEEYYGALYLVDRETLARYWTDPNDLDSFVRKVCGLVNPVWSYWIEFYQALNNKSLDARLGLYSMELADILNDAASLALKMKTNPRKKPRLRTEHFVAALAARPKLLFTKRLIRAGFVFSDMEKGFS